MRWIQSQIQSSTLKMPIAFDVLLPESNKPMDSLYLLHDSNMEHSQWLRLGIESFFEHSNCALIMPQGNNSLFLNTKNNYNFFDFLTNELPSLCSTWFSLKNERTSRYISGIGTGGYTAILAAFAIPSFYHKVVAIEGQFDINSFYVNENGNDISKWLGDQETFKNSTVNLWNPTTISINNIDTDITLITNELSNAYEQNLKLSNHLSKSHPNKIHFESLQSKQFTFHAMSKLSEIITDTLEEVTPWQ